MNEYIFLSTDRKSVSLRTTRTKATPPSGSYAAVRAKLGDVGALDRWTAAKLAAAGIARVTPAEFDAATETVTARDFERNGDGTIAIVDGAATETVTTAAIPAEDLAAQAAAESARRRLLAVGGVQAECARRLAAGFDFDFGDERGVHRIGTTDKDMAGWDEVSKLAQARINTSDATVIVIATDTGIVQVSPMEWQDILKAAAAFRQPIWLASFTLQTTNPIPADYAADEHWEAQ